MRKIIPSLFAALTIACSDIEETPGGIAVDKNGYNPDMSLIDRKYTLVEDCVRELGLPIQGQRDSLLVLIVTNEDWFTCEASLTGRCRGLYFIDRGQISIPENLKAFGYESGHHIGQSLETEGPAETCGNHV